ncbi:hypothetical protein LTR27_005607 [Elasticomyces elasticus]|nr:hypothetical protein LTR27_005607 [Elasticomyces elasticus]
MGKPRTPGPASKKRKADDARYTEGEEASNKTIPGTTAGRRFTKAELATIPTRPRAQRDTHDTQIPFGTAVQISDTRISDDAVLSVEDQAYFDSEARLDRRPAIKQEADQDAALEDIPPHSDDSGYGAPDSDAKVDVKSAPAAHSTSADQHNPTVASSSWHKTPVQADMKYELAGIDEALTPPVFHAGSLLDGCLDVLRYVPCNTKFYAQALEKVLKHAADSPKDIPSVLGGLRDYLPQDRYQPVAQELIGNDLQHQALMLVVNIDTPLMLRQVLSTIFHGVQQEFLSEVPDILAHVPGAPSLPISSNAAYAHTPPVTRHERHTTPGGPAKRCKVEMASSPPVTQDTVAVESTVMKAPWPTCRDTSSQPSSGPSNSAPTPTNPAHTGSSNADLDLTPTLIPFVYAHNHERKAMYTFNCPNAPSTTVDERTLMMACAMAFARHNIETVERCNAHAWIVTFKYPSLASRACWNPISLQGITLTGDRLNTSSPKVFTWESAKLGMCSKLVARRLHAVWSTRYPDLVVRFRRTKAKHGQPVVYTFVVGFPTSPQLSSFFLPLRLGDGTVTAWFKPLKYLSPCPLCEGRDHQPETTCNGGKLAKFYRS